MSSWYDKKKAKWDRLTEGERNYLVRHPWDADEIEDSANKALSEASKRFGKGSLHNGAGDAFRHCYWNALLARDIGKDNALEFTTAHESQPGNPADEKSMDLHNNKAGADIGASSPNTSDEILASKCQQALIDGKLKVLTP